MFVQWPTTTRWNVQTQEEEPVALTQYVEKDCKLLETVFWRWLAHRQWLLVNYHNVVTYRKKVHYYSCVPYIATKYDLLHRTFTGTWAQYMEPPGSETKDLAFESLYTWDDQVNWPKTTTDVQNTNFESADRIARNMSAFPH